MNAERPVVFECRGDRLVGVLHAAPGEPAIGVVIVVGGPQYRAGSHRQFVSLARQLAAGGISVLRFDHRGTGDSEGEARPFTALDADIRAAIDFLLSRQPHLRHVVLLGLCDAASAILMYSASDTRLSGLTLINPWVRTESAEAQSYVRHYYFQRLLQKSFWRKVIGGEFDVRRSISEFLRSLWLATGRGAAASQTGTGENRGFIDRMLAGAETFSKPVLVLISERDLTAQQFAALCRQDAKWHKAMAQPERQVHPMPGADHTFSRKRDCVAAGEAILAWLNSAVAAGRESTAHACH